jgi:hypothetical protein
MLHVSGSSPFLHLPLHSPELQGDELTGISHGQELFGWRTRLRTRLFVLHGRDVLQRKERECVVGTWVARTIYPPPVLTEITLREMGSEKSAGSNIWPVVEGRFTALHYFDSSLRGLRPETALEFHHPGGESRANMRGNCLFTRILCIILAVTAF